MSRLSTTIKKQRVKSRIIRLFNATLYFQRVKQATCSTCSHSLKTLKQIEGFPKEFSQRGGFPDVHCTTASFSDHFIFDTWYIFNEVRN